MARTMNTARKSRLCLFDYDYDAFKDLQMMLICKENGFVDCEGMVTPSEVNHFKLLMNLREAGVIDPQRRLDFHQTAIRIEATKQLVQRVQFINPWKLNLDPKNPFNGNHGYQIIRDQFVQFFAVPTKSQVALWYQDALAHKQQKLTMLKRISIIIPKILYTSFEI